MEPLVLRLRPTILNTYYPERAQQRAVWLCGYVLRERGGALRTMARLAGRRTSQGGAPREPLKLSSLIESLKDRYQFNCLKYTNLYYVLSVYNT